MVVTGLRPFLAVLGIACLLPPPAVAQKTDCSPSSGAIVHGLALDASSGVPLGFARIELHGSALEKALSTRSDTKGAFAFCGVPPGQVIVQGVMGPLVGGVGPVDVGEGRVVEVTVELRDAEHSTGTLAGRVFDAETGEAVEGASVFVTDLGLSVLTNGLGAFAFPSVVPGPHEVRVQRIGYAEAGGPVRVERWRATETRISLTAEAIEMEPIVVIAVRRRVDLPDIEDFERRYYSGWGTFVLEDDIRMRSPMRLTDVLVDTGLDVDANGLMVNSRRTMCAPLVYIDDVLVTHQSRSQPTPLKNRLYPWADPSGGPAEETAAALNMVHPANVLAVEIYKGPAETPGQYIDSNSKCGVILVWTRRGR